MKMAEQSVQVSWILFLTIWSIKWDFGAAAAANLDAPSFEAAFQGKCGPSSPCVQLCVELHDGTFECQCRAGFRLLQDGYSCVEIVNTTFGEDSEEEWIRTNTIQNNIIHEHHEQQRDLLNNYRRSQASRLSYYPFNGNLEESTPGTNDDSERKSSSPRPKTLLAIDNTIHSANLRGHQFSDRYDRNSIPKTKTTAFSFANKFSFDSHELPVLFGRGVEINDERLTVVSSSENQIEDEESSSEEEEEEDDDDEDEDDDETEVDDLFQTELRYLQEQIGEESRRKNESRTSTTTTLLPPTTTATRASVSSTSGPVRLLEDTDDQGQLGPMEDSSLERNRITISDNFDLDQSESALADLKSSSVVGRGEEVSDSMEKEEEGEGEVLSPSEKTTSTFPTVPPDSTTTLSALSSTIGSSVSSEEEMVGSSSSHHESHLNQQCPLQCKNGGWCSWEGRFGELVSTSKSQSSVVAVPLENSAEQLTGYRCLCPMGYHGSFCEIEDGSDGNGYTSGLFRGQSWVAFPVLHDAYMSDQISLEFRPETPNGILLLTGERDDLSGDFLALYLRDGYLEFRFDCGSGWGMVRSSQAVNLQQWNRASILRRRWDGWMQLNDGPFTQGRSKGLFSRITFRQPVFIGGAGNITFGGSSSPTDTFASSGAPGNNNNNNPESKTSPNKLDESESEFETESPSGGIEGSSVTSEGAGTAPSSPSPLNETKNSTTSDVQDDDPSAALPILRKIGGFLGCIRNLIINDRTYRFGLEPTGDVIQGFDVENCNDQGVCDLLSCQHGGQCIVQKDENPTCLCPLGFTGHLCETPLDLQIPSFNGSSYLKYGGLGLSRVLSWLELEIIVKPDAMDGLILYNGYKTDGMGDFISLVIDQGYFEFAMDLGTGTAIIRSEYPVVLGEWHRILISRTSRLIFMRIDNQSPLMALTPGAFTQLSLPHNLFLGGIPDAQWLSPKVKVHGGFVGCIQKFVINEKPLRIMGSAMSGVNLENCAHPCLRNPCDHGGECVPQLDSFKCHCPLGYRDMHCQTRMDRQDVITAPKLIGDSYLRFTHPKIIKRISGSRLNLSFRIRTSLSRGLILWAGRKLMTSASDFISVGLRNGFIHTSFSLGSGQTNIAYNYTTVHDGQWHLVRIVRNEQEASLSVDDGPPVIGVAPGKLRQLNINDGLYIGGLDDPRHQSMNKYSEGLVGCITDVILANDYRVALLQDASEGRNVDYCD